MSTRGRPGRSRRGWKETRWIRLVVERWSIRHAWFPLRDSGCVDAVFGDVDEDIAAVSDIAAAAPDIAASEASVSNFPEHLCRS